MSALPPSGQHLSIWNKAKFPFHQPCLFHCFFEWWAARSHFWLQNHSITGYDTICNDTWYKSALQRVCKLFPGALPDTQRDLPDILASSSGYRKPPVVLSFCCLLFCWVLFHVYCPCKLLFSRIALSDPLFTFLHHIFLVDVWLFMYFSCRALMDSHPANVTFQFMVCLCILAVSFSYRTF